MTRQPPRQLQIQEPPVSDTLQFDRAKHVYSSGGVVLESVTQVLSRAGQIVAWGDAEDLARGSYVHHATALYDRGSLDFRRVAIEWRGFVYAWRNWKRDSGFRVQIIETPVFDAELGIAGTPDRIGLLDSFKGIRVVVDLKSNKAGQIAESVKYQLAAYAMMSRRNPGERLERIGLALTPSGQYSVKHFPMDSLLADWSQFLEWKNGGNNGNGSGNGNNGD